MVPLRKRTIVRAITEFPRLGDVLAGLLDIDTLLAVRILRGVLSVLRPWWPTVGPPRAGGSQIWGPTGLRA